MTEKTLNRLSASGETSSGSARTCIKLNNSVIKICNPAWNDAAMYKFMREHSNLRLGDFFNMDESGITKMNGAFRDMDTLACEPMGQMFMEWKAWMDCPEHLRYLLAPITGFGFTSSGMPYTVMHKVTPFTEGGDDYDYSLDDQYGGLMNLIEENYEVSATFEQDVEELCDYFNLNSCDIWDNLSNSGIDRNGDVVILDYGWGGDADNWDTGWNPTIKELMGA